MKWISYLDIEASFVITDLLQVLEDRIKQAEKIINGLQNIAKQIKELKPDWKPPDFQSDLFFFGIKQQFINIRDYYLQQQWLHVTLKSNEHKDYAENRENFMYFLMGLDPKKVSWIEAMTIYYPKMKDQLIFTK